MQQRVARLWSWMQPRLHVLLPVIAIVLALPALWAGFFMDDYAHVAVLAGRETRMAMTPTDLFVFADGVPAAMHRQMDQGVFPWWTVAELRLAFFRPLSVLFMQLDYAIAGEWAPFYHAHSTVWFVLLVIAAAALYRRSLAAPVAALAALLFTLDDGHAAPVIWVANRNALIATTFGLFGLLAHLRAREQGWRPGLLLGPLALAAALSSAEVALAMAAYFPAYEMWAAPGTRPNRAKHLLPYALVVIGYLLLHSALGYGSAGSAVYLDPRSAPLPWAAAAPGRALALLGGLLVNSPVDVWALDRATEWPLSIAGLLGVLAFAALTRAAWPKLAASDKGRFRFFAGGALLSLVPAVSTFPNARMLLAASVGGFGCIALVVVAALKRSEKLIRGCAKGLLVLHLVAAFAWIAQHTVFVRSAEAARIMMRSIQLGELQPDSLLVTLFAPDPVSSFYPQMMREAEGLPIPKERAILSMSGRPQRFTRTGERQLELEVLEGALLETPFERLVRDDSTRLQPGDVIPSRHLDAEVLTATQGAVTQVRFTFRKSLDDPSMVLLSWQGDGMRRITAPPIGESLTYEASAGVLGAAF